MHNSAKKRPLLFFELLPKNSTLLTAMKADRVKMIQCKLQFSGCYTLTSQRQKGSFRCCSFLAACTFCLLSHHLLTSGIQASPGIDKVASLRQKQLESHLHLLCQGCYMSTSQREGFVQVFFIPSSICFLFACHYLLTGAIRHHSASTRQPPYARSNLDLTWACSFRGARNASAAGFQRTTMKSWNRLSSLRMSLLMVMLSRSCLWTSAEAYRGAGSPSMALKQHCSSTSAPTRVRWSVWLRLATATHPASPARCWCSGEVPRTRSKMLSVIWISDRTRSDLVRARMVFGSLLAALTMPRAVLLSRDGMVASTTQRTRVSGLLRYLEARAWVQRCCSSGKVWRPGRSMSSMVGTSTCARAVRG